MAEETAKELVQEAADLVKKAEAMVETAGPVDTAAKAEAVDQYVAALEAGKPFVALVGKYTDRVPVQIKSAGHLEELRAMHGDVEVQEVS